jgi:hypothetical protein
MLRNIPWRALGLVWALAFLALLLIYFLTATGISYAHTAPSGWAYPPECCGGHDCAPLPLDQVDIEPDPGGGWVVVPTGQRFAANDKLHVHISPDGYYHRCAQDGRKNGYTYCIFVPAGI